MHWAKRQEIDKVTEGALSAIIDTIHDLATPDAQARRAELELALCRAFILGRHAEVQSRMNSRELQLKQARTRCNRLLNTLEALEKESAGEEPA